jgi:hypothetical protein
MVKGFSLTRTTTYGESGRITGRSLVKVFDIRNDAHFQGVENLPSPGDGVSVSVGSCRSQRVKVRLDRKREMLRIAS